MGANKPSARGERGALLGAANVTYQHQGRPAGPLAAADSAAGGPAAPRFNLDTTLRHAARGPQHKRRSQQAVRLTDSDRGGASLPRALVQQLWFWSRRGRRGCVAGLGTMQPRWQQAAAGAPPRHGLGRMGTICPWARSGAVRCQGAPVVCRGPVGRCLCEAALRRGRRSRASWPHAWMDQFLALYMARA